MTTSISSLSSPGGYNQMFAMNAQFLQQRQNDLFNKIDSDGSGGVDKTEFSAFAKKLSQDSGETVSADDIFSTYDTNNDSTLSSDELQAFMKDNPPPPPPGGPGEGMGPQNDLFTKLDSDGSGGIDQSEFSTFAGKISQDTGQTINVDNVFSQYDANNDGSLSADELKAYMKDNAPTPPDQMQNAASAYSANQSDDQTSLLLDLLKNISALVQSSSDGNGSSINAYLTKVMESISNGTGSSVLSVTA